MKIEKIKFHNHEILGDLEVDFQDKNGKNLDIIVFIGENGSGKTSLLKSIYSSFGAGNTRYEEVEDYKVKLTSSLYTIIVRLENGELATLHPDVKNTFFTMDSKDPKVIFMPVEINFEKINKVDNTFDFIPKFQNIIDQNMTQNIPSFIATKINKEIFKNRNKIIGEVIDKVCEDINSIFKIMELDVKLIGLSETNETKPVFRNSLGNEFDITGLSSGEKQLFLRALSLKFLEVNNSLILIDEPEISLHPQWQKKIIEVYKRIGNNNQLIIATHSPHIIGDIESKQLRIIKRDKDGISIVDNNEISETYGKNVGDILSTTMKINSLRNDDITRKLNRLYELLNNNQYKSTEFNEIFDCLRCYLGELDKDIMRIRLDISIRNRKNVKS
ncbi:AAA family ATPase [Clostridium sp. FP1]|uniref:AAA family ATPase n=1 Tax=Clostridium sp. FP1 TaxID=2724076 RepID=UPI0013E99DB1|nr:ATP-binding protein [Clostridium sp. FP1]MBZ9633335.1 AAA family ATPase [Clostridium sp. FP1]